MNIWSRFQSLSPDPALLIGTVRAHLSGDRSQIELVSGRVIYASGTSVAVGSRAWVRDGKVEGDAPALAGIEIEV